MSWGRGFGSARFDHFSKDRIERLGLLEVDVVPSSGNDAARNCALVFCLKGGSDLAIFRVKLPRQIAYGNALRSQLAKRANRLAPQRHLVGTRLLERERERFRVVGKAARPKTFPLVNWKIALAFEKRQGFPPGHEGEHPFAAHARCPREVALAQRPSRGGVSGAESCAFKNERGKGSGSGHPRRIVSRSRCRIPLTDPSHVQAISSIAWSEGCGASERNATELIAVPQVARDRIQAAISTARSEGCGASERNAVDLAAVPQVARNKARRLKSHAPAHGIADQYGEPSRDMRHGFAESKECLRLKDQVERLATWNIANRRVSALPMPRKLESKALHARARKRQGNFIPGGSLLREAVNEHNRGR